MRLHRGEASECTVRGAERTTPTRAANLNHSHTGLEDEEREEEEEQTQNRKSAYLAPGSGNQEGRSQKEGVCTKSGKNKSFDLVAVLQTSTTERKDARTQGHGYGRCCQENGSRLRE